jgi:CheY-like chemotaxis protein
VDVSTASGSGTAFRLYFPVAGGSLPQETERELVPRRPATGKEKILLVEDEAGVRKLTQRFLEESGYNVLVATNGQEALRMVDGQDDVRLLLTDVVMPGMGGRELYERIASPTMGVVFMSGYAADEGPLVPAASRAPWAFLQKPFPLGKLQETMRDVLDRTPDGARKAESLDRS